MSTQSTGVVRLSKPMQQQFVDSLKTNCVWPCYLNFRENIDHLHNQKFSRNKKVSEINYKIIVGINS